jgi:hypothetical protein
LYSNRRFVMTMPRGKKVQQYVLPYLDEVLRLSPGSSISLSMPSHELTSCKNAWYRSLVSMGLTDTYTLSMDPPKDTFFVTHVGKPKAGDYPSRTIDASDHEAPLQTLHRKGVKTLNPAFQSLIEQIQSEVDLGAQRDYVLATYGRTPGGSTYEWLLKFGFEMVHWPSADEIAATVAEYKEATGRTPEFAHIAGLDPDEDFVDNLDAPPTEKIPLHYAKDKE